MLRNVCGGGDDGESCPGAYLCAVESTTCTTQNDCAATQSCVDFGEPDARCGSGTFCGNTMQCADPAESCLCFD